MFSNTKISNVIGSAREEIVPPLQLNRMSEAPAEVMSRRSLAPINNPPGSGRISEMKKDEIIVNMDH